MQKLTSVKKWIRSVALVFAVCICCFVGLTFPVNAEGLGDCSHGYVNEIKLQAYSTLQMDIPDYVFEPQTTEYDVSLYNGAPVRIVANVTGEDLYYLLTVNGVASSRPSVIGNGVDQAIMGSAWSKIASADCGDNTFTVRIGKCKDQKTLTDYDEYVFHYTLKPSFTSIKVSEITADNTTTQLTLSPVYKSGIWYFEDKFSVTTSSSEISLTLGFKTPNTTCYLGAGNDVIVSNTNAINITLAEYWNDEIDMGVLPLRLVYKKGDVEFTTTNYLFIANEHKELSPVITEQPQNVICSKNDTPILSVVAQKPNIGTISYQWYSGKNTDYLLPVEGQTSATLALSKSDTAWAGIGYYQCYVTNTLDLGDVGSVSFTTKTDIVSVETQLSYVSAPTVLKELGTFTPQQNKADKPEYKTEYHNGQKFDKIYISVLAPEDGVTYSLSYYCSATPKFENATELDVTYNRTKSSPEFHQYGAEAKNGFQEGIYYLFCKVTATDGAGRSAYTISGPVKLTYSKITLDFEYGQGTPENPYQLHTVADLKKLQEIVYNGQWCDGVCFKIMNDIYLPEDWKSIGDKNPDLVDAIGRTIQAFSGSFDGGGHKLTVAKGGKPLFGYVSDAVIKNLDIYGEEIDGNGLIDQMHADYGEDGDYWTGVPDCVTIQNVRLLSGSSTRRSGFMEGSGSGANTIHIEDCVIEKGVTIGYTHEEYSIGSFVGSMLNGEIKNSYSEADVYGTSRMGGLAGSKGQSMGMCQIVNSHFSGNLIATGEWVGGLIGGGYVSESAPNTMAVSFWNCYVDGNITGKDYVGGLFGGEEGLKGCINECWLQDSFFYGTITAEGEHVGGIIGYMASINKVQLIENNYFYEKSGKVTELIGEVGRYHTSGSFGFADEDALNTFKANMGSAKTPEEFKNGTVKDLLNAGSDYRNWVQGELYPVHSGAAYLTGLTLSGEYKTVYRVGEELDLTGLATKATWSDGSETDVPLSNLTITGFDSSKAAQLTLNVAYEGATATIVVRVEEDFEPSENSVQVTFSVSHDDSFVAGEISGEVAALYDLEVPYFDLELYGLEDYYYGGTATSANGNITMLHLFLYATEVIECGYDESEAGRGLLYEDDLLNTKGGKLTITGGSGSLYMTNFWGYDPNLTYYLNYVYPLRDAAIGETADQIVLHDGDIVTLGHFSNGSYYSDATSGYNYIKTNANNDTAEKGQSVELSVYRTKLLKNYQTEQVAVEAALDVYYTSTDKVSKDFTDWKKLTTDASGKLTVDTNVLDAGEYIFAVAGQKGSTLNAICSAPGGVILTVEKSADQKAADEVIALIDAIGEVTLESKDAIEAAEEAYDALTEEQKALVSNHQKLLDARAAYDKLVEDAQKPVIPDIPVVPGTPTAPSKPSTPAVPEAPSFTDISGHWATDAIEYAVANGLMNGTGNGLFSPNANTTRGMIVTILARLEGVDTSKGGNWYEAGQQWAMKLGISDGTNMDGQITREQLATMLYRYAQLKGYDTTARADLSTFADAKSVSDWAVEAMQWAVGTGLMEGSNNQLTPTAPATRAQVATILMRLIENVAK